MSAPASAVVAALRAAGCVFAEEEATLLAAEAADDEALSLMVARRVAGEPLEQKQIDRVQAVRARRDAEAVERELAALKEAAARDDHNLMPNLLDCARVHASEGEIVESLQRVFGTYTETPVF